MSEGLVQWEIGAPYERRRRGEEIVKNCVDITLTVKRGSDTARAVQELLAIENYGVDKILLGTEAIS